jgi:hypothetical protein
VTLNELIEYPLNQQLPQSLSIRLSWSGNPHDNDDQHEDEA